MQPLTRDNIRLAATVVLLRQRRTGPEVFMMQRPGGGDFPDLHVFPGGKLDAADVLDPYVSGCSDATANRLLGLSGGGLRYWVAAIRECFEECGVLLARRHGAFVRLTQGAEMERFAGYRQQLIDGDLSMAELCERERIVLAADCLLYHSHWITPEMAPRRFDTRFFVARMPAQQATAAHATETADAHWVSPKSALAAHSNGDLRMIAPTLITLQTLAGHDRVDAIWEAVHGERHLPELTDELRHQGMHPLR